MSANDPANDKTPKPPGSLTMLWERTQAIIAIAVTGAMIHTAASGHESPALAQAFGMVILLYFQKATNGKPS